jgi:O-antigen ligase
MTFSTITTSTITTAFNLTRLLIFVSFFLLALRMVVALLLQIMPLNAVLLGIGLLFTGLLTIWNAKAVLLAFVGAVPLLSGLQAAKFLPAGPLLEAFFAAIYLCWLPKRLAMSKNRLETTQASANLVDLLSGIVFLSLFFLMVRYPPDFVFHRLFHYPFGVQGEALHGIDAAHTILSGLFLFRLLTLELKGYLSNVVKYVLSAHLIIILAFSSLQFFAGIPPLHWGSYGFKSPFSDIHCYGAYVSLLFCYFASFFLSSNPRMKMFLAILLLSLFFLIIFSGGNMTLWAFIAVGMFLLAAKSKKLFALVALLFVLCLGTLFYMPSILSESSLPVARRYAKAIDITKLPEDTGSVISRLALWDRALTMIRQFPLTGTGIGTFYAMSPSYHDNRITSWTPFKNFMENVHNYYLQIAAELGVPALILFLAAVLNCFRRKPLNQGKEIPHTYWRKGLMAGLAVYLLSMLTSHHLLVSTQQFLFWFAVAALDASSKEESV